MSTKFKIFVRHSKSPCTLVLEGRSKDSKEGLEASKGAGDSDELETRNIERSLFAGKV